jgi:predicted transcriptional regulator
VPTSVLLSLKPQFAHAIFAGTKTFEFRRALFRRPDVTRVVVYASSPVQRVIGVFEIEDILSMAPRDLWRATSHGAGITRDYFDRYFDGRELAYAIKVRTTRRFARPRRLDRHYGVLTPPQSFCYLE